MDDWQRDFVPLPTSSSSSTASGSAGSAGSGGDWLGLDHVGIAVDAEHVNETMSFFFRTVLDLAPGTVEEFMEPHGRLRSRALRPAAGDLRVVVNVADRGRSVETPHGVTHCASRCPTWLPR